MTVIAETIRSGVVECEHHGSVVVLSSDGEVQYSVGVPETPIMPRSSNKPMQTVGMIRCGLHLPSPLIAIATASHAGEEMHTTRVLRLLATAGLTPAALRCPADQPGDPASAISRACAGLGPDPLLMNCSGKHAAMLATCVLNGWPVQTYLDPQHPLQVALAATVAGLAGEPIQGVAVDGCGAPILRISLVGLATAFHRMVTADHASPERAVVDACLEHPLLLAGSARPDGLLAQSVPGLFAKVGAEGVYAAALPDGRALAVRTHDGATRATQAVVGELLHRWGIQSTELDRQRAEPVLGGGAPVGEVRATLP